MNKFTFMVLLVILSGFAGCRTMSPSSVVEPETPIDSLTDTISDTITDTIPIPVPKPVISLYLTNVCAITSCVIMLDSLGTRTTLDTIYVTQDTAIVCSVTASPIISNFYLHLKNSNKSYQGSWPISKDKVISLNCCNYIIN
jgi:hypothetical protein